MNIRDLQYFLAVAELRHFGDAAKQCHVSQPTLSGQIKKLEEQLGVVLFERTNRRVMLTESGRMIAVAARRAMREIEAIHDIAESTKDPFSGKFRLGAFPTLATYVFPSIVTQVMASMPALRLILIEEKTEQLLDQLAAGDIDAALLSLPVDDDRLTSAHWFNDIFYLAVPNSHHLANATAVHMGELSQEKLLLLEEGHCLRDQSLDVCQVHNIKEEQDFKATGLETLRQMVKVGTGITIIPDIARRAGEEDAIRYIPFTDPAPHREIGLVWRKTSARTKVMERLSECWSKAHT